MGFHQKLYDAALNTEYQYFFSNHMLLALSLSAPLVVVPLPHLRRWKKSMCPTLFNIPGMYVCATRSMAMLQVEK